MRGDDLDAGEGAGRVPPGPAPAGLAWRGAARAVDVVVALWLIAVLSVEVETRLLGFDPAEGGRVRLALVSVLVVVALEVVPVAAWGRSLGKAAFGLRVAVADDAGGAGVGAGRDGAAAVAVPGAARALARTALVYAPLVAPIAGVVLLVVVLAPAVLDRWGRGLHDRLAGTIVVSVSGASGGPGGGGESGSGDGDPSR